MAFRTIFNVIGGGISNQSIRGGGVIEVVGFQHL